MIREKVLKAKDIVSKLEIIATNDKEITNEEKELILSIGRNIQKYFEFVKNIPLNNEIDKTEEILILEKKIVQDATAKAFEDGKVSSNEKKLLHELVKLMEEIAEIE